MSIRSSSRGRASTSIPRRRATPPHKLCAARKRCSRNVARIPGGSTAVSCVRRQSGHGVVVRQAGAGQHRQGSRAGSTAEPASRAEWARWRKSSASRASTSPSATRSAPQRPQAADVFVNTWSVEGFVCRRPAAGRTRLGATTKSLPGHGRTHSAVAARDLSVCPGRQYARAHLAPIARRAVRLSRHAQRVDFDRRLFHRCATRPARPSIARPAITPTIRPMTRCCRCTKCSAAAGKMQPEWKILTSTRSSTASTNWACCSMATPKTPIGTARNSPSRRRATSRPIRTPPAFRSSSAALAGMVWALENPEAGIVEADEVDYKRCLDVQLPYLGP